MYLNDVGTSLTLAVCPRSTVEEAPGGVNVSVNQSPLRMFLVTLRYITERVPTVVDYWLVSTTPHHSIFRTGKVGQTLVDTSRCKQGLKE